MFGTLGILFAQSTVLRLITPLARMASLVVIVMKDITGTD
jgi:hypothetical protein